MKNERQGVLVEDEHFAWLGSAKRSNARAVIMMRDNAVSTLAG